MTSISDYGSTRYSERALHAGGAASLPHASGIARRQRRAQAGQSLIIAIAVLFLLAFLAALFITLLAKNLDRANHSSQVLTADFYAQAGIRYADQMLTTSPQGADWRPPMKYYLGDTYAKLIPNPSNMTEKEVDPTSTSLTATEQAAYAAYVNYSTTGLKTINAHDPDKFWLEQGFTRYPAQGGRYLIRLSYGYAADVTTNALSATTADPYEQNNQTTGKYIRIESVGRTGVVDDTNPSDPTIFSAQPTRLNATLVAFKPIGLTDYARFITNRDQRSDTFALGVPSRYYTDAATPTNSSIVTPGVDDFTFNGTGSDLTQYPLVTSYGTINGTAGSGGSLRCNGNLRLYGMNVAFLDNTLGDDWEVAGDLTFDGYQDGSTSTDPSALQVVKGAIATGNVVAATPSNAVTFDTLGGLIRDSGSASDNSGYARNIQRLNPPVIDSPASGAGGVGHYAALTNHGTQLSASTGGPYVAETPNGPATVYIDNTSDEQPESSSAQVGSTLRDDWLNPQKNINGYWHGPFYDPPGATIVFGPQYVTLTDGTTQARWGFTVTRSDSPIGLGDESHVTWRWNGESSGTSLTASTCTFIYGSAPTTKFAYSATNPIFFIGADDVPQSQVSDPMATAQSVDNDIVIYAEGNLRVRGTVSPTGESGQGTDANGRSDPDQVTITDPADQTTPYKLRASPHHVTLVTNQIAYVEGSLLKGGSFNTATGKPISTGLSSIAVLARRYVTLNTTQLLAGAVQHSNLAQQQVDASPGGTGSSGALDFGADSSLTESFDVPYDAYTGAVSPQNSTAAAPSLFVSQYSSGSGTENSTGLLRLVETAFDGTSYITQTTLDGTPSPGTTPAPTLAGSSAAPNRIVIPLSGSPTTFPQFSPAYTYAAPSVPGSYHHFDLTFAKSPSSVADYELAKAAVLPSDVHIEAVLYAQNNSFFVIPGEWFNDDASDTMKSYADQLMANATPLRPRPTPGNAAGGVTDPQFPMYGQPIDMKITINGSVSENVPADISDQAAWMQHWGWIPKYHGTPPGTGAGIASPHPQLPATALDGDNVLPAQIAQTVPPTGLTFVYDSAETAPDKYKRVDQYGRPLPFTPNMPVSPDLLYSGQPTGNSLVQ